MGQKIKQDGNQKGRSLKEDLKRLDEAGLLDKSSKEKSNSDDVKKQQETGDTGKSDRRL